MPCRTLFFFLIHCAVRPKVDMFGIEEKMALSCCCVVTVPIISRSQVSRKSVSYYQHCQETHCCSVSSLSKK